MMKLIRNFVIIILIILGLFFSFKYIKTNKQVVLSFDEDLYSLAIGEELELKPKIEKGRLVGEVKLEYQSLDEAVVSYNNGLIIAKAAGEAKVKVFLKNNEDVFAETIIKVNPKAKYDIVYYLNGGTNHSLNVNSYEEKSEVDLFPPTKEGYKFVGWYLDPGLTKKIEKITTNNTGKINLYAKWEVIHYTINYYLDGGINHLDNKEKYTINDEVIFQNPAKEGYVFLGWFLEPDFKTEIISIAKGSKNSIILYAKWEEKSYKVNYHLNGGINSPLNKEIIYESDLPFNLINPTREGYIFLGWFLSSDFKNQITSISSVSTDEINVYAKWEEIIYTYNIFYHLDDGINHPNNPNIYQESSLPITLLNPTKEGYEFLGWFMNSDYSGEKITVLSVGFKQDITLYAKWQKIIIYQIDYILDGGINHSQNPTQFSAKDLPITLKNPTKEGFIFIGWFESVDFTGEKIEVISKDYHDDIILYAYFMSASEYHARVALEFAQYSRLEVDFNYAKEMINLVEDPAAKAELNLKLLAIEVIDDDVIRDDSTIIN